MRYYEKIISSHVTRLKIGYPEHLFLWQEKQEPNTKQIMEIYRSGDYDLIQEDSQINRLRLMVAVGDVHGVDELVRKMMGLVSLQKKREDQ